MGEGGRGAYDSGEMFLNYIRKGQRILKEGKDKIKPQHNNIYSLVKFLFSFIVNSLSYISIPKNKGK